MIINMPKGETDSPIEVLYDYYAERYPINNDGIWQKSEALLKLLPPEEQDRIMTAVSLLVEEHEREAFTRGIQTGVRLAEELKEE